MVDFCRCADCKHWGHEQWERVEGTVTEASGLFLRMARNQPTGRRYCTRVYERWNTETLVQPDPWIANLYSQEHQVRIATAPEFGCVAWTEREPEALQLKEGEKIA